MNFLTYPHGVINLDHVTRVVVDNDGAFTFHMSDGEDVQYGLNPGTGLKAEGVKAIQQITGASDIQVYDF
jgi:hypothetical protein